MPPPVSYLSAVASYGILRSAYVLSGAHIEVTNNNTMCNESRPLFFFERLYGVALGTFLTASAAPLVLAKDLYTLELVYRGRYHLENPKRKNQPMRSPFQHIYVSLLD